ncbi:MAG: hypothetical protein SWK76_15095 [Actinomycetota bacterium]|nr:hypothetical protein [Actinomycetota bacterium]
MPCTNGSGSGGFRPMLVALCILLLVALALVVALGGCGEGQEAVDTEDREEETATVDEDEDDSLEEENGEYVELDEEYTNEMYGYSLSYPSSWGLTEILNGHGCSITDPEHEDWEVLAWGDPALDKTPEEWLDEQYNMMSAVFDAERDPSTLDVGTFDGYEYAYDYWTTYVPAGDYSRYYEVFVMESGGEIFFVTGDYPVDDVEEAEPIVIGIMDSLTPP